LFLAGFKLQLAISELLFVLLGTSICEFGLLGCQVVLTFLKPEPGAAYRHIVTRQNGVEFRFAAIQLALPLLQVCGQLLCLGAELLDN
jgi:hypothetical protein